MYFQKAIKKFFSGRGLNPYTSENMLTKHKPKCEINDVTTIKTSGESHLHWKNHFHKNPLHLRIDADFEADIERDSFSIGNITTTFFKQNPVLYGYHIESELEDVLKGGYDKSPLGYDNVDWFVNEVEKPKKLKWLFTLKKLIKISLRLKKMRKIMKTIMFVDFVHRNFYLIK